MNVRILEGDALDRLAELEAGSVDACVSDPPYGLSFMGKAWDHGVPGEPYWREVARVLKPGAHLLAFGGTRTYHRLTVAIEDAGFEIRDCLMWLYGSGFPKGKACLKPGWEPIVLARKPGKGRWLNVDGCRIAGPPSVGGNGSNSGNGALGRLNDDAWQSKPRQIDREIAAGRWPANVALSHEDGCREVGTKRVKGANWKDEDARYGALGYQGGQHGVGGKHYGVETVAAWECVETCAVRMLDEQSGHTVSRAGKPRSGSKGNGWRTTHTGAEYDDAGGASRFYYCAKASSAERRPYNDHPTVKPLALMQWLVRLVTPAGGVVLDPFCGSGSTLIAADREGFNAIGIDNDPHAVEIARQRIADDAGLLLAGVAS